MVQANQLRELVEQTKNALPEDHEAFVMILTRALALLDTSQAAMPQVPIKKTVQKQRQINRNVL